MTATHASPTPRERLLALALAPVANVAVVALSFDAVAKKLIHKLGISGINFKLTSLVDTVLKPADNAGAREITALITAIVALLFLGAIVYFIFGLLKTMGGRRGGIEAVGTVVFAMVFGMAIYTVLA